MSRKRRGGTGAWPKAKRRGRWRKVWEGRAWRALLWQVRGSRKAEARWERYASEILGCEPHQARREVDRRFGAGPGGTPDVPAFFSPLSGTLPLSGGVGWVPDGAVIGAGPGPKITVDGQAHDVPEGIEIDPRSSRAHEALREAAAIIRNEETQ